MVAFIRRVFVLACTGGGVYGSFVLLQKAVDAAGGGHLRMEGEGIFLMLPCAAVGAGVGAIIGGLIFPAKL